MSLVVTRTLPQAPFQPAPNAGSAAPDSGPTPSARDDDGASVEDAVDISARLQRKLSDPNDPDGAALRRLKQVDEQLRHQRHDAAAERLRQLIELVRLLRLFGDLASIRALTQIAKQIGAAAEDIAEGSDDAESLDASASAPAEPATATTADAPPAQAIADAASATISVTVEESLTATVGTAAAGQAALNQSGKQGSATASGIADSATDRDLLGQAAEAMSTIKKLIQEAQEEERRRKGKASYELEESSKIVGDAAARIMGALGETGADAATSVAVEAAVSVTVSVAATVDIVA
jgi:hypothetical protein